MPQRKLHPAPEDEARYHEILEAALRLFSSHGYAKTSIDKIAREVGATKGLIYYYFRTKDEILHAVLEVYDFRDAIETIPAMDASIPIHEAVGIIVQGSLKLLDTNVAYVRFLYAEGQFVVTENRLQAILDRLHAALRNFMDRRVSVGELRPHDTELGAQQLADAVLAWFLKSRFINPDIRKTYSGREYFAHWIESYLAGLRPNRRSQPPKNEGETFRMG